MLGGSDFEASWWRMQELGSREMLVPLTCCHLANAPGDERAFLDPLPHNNTVCQAPNPAENKAERFQKVKRNLLPGKRSKLEIFVKSKMAVMRHKCHAPWSFFCQFSSDFPLIFDVHSIISI